MLNLYVFFAFCPIGLFLEADERCLVHLLSWHIIHIIIYIYTYDYICMYTACVMRN